MIKISQNTNQDQRGVAIVEFAIVASLLFILLFGIFEFGRLFYVLNSVQEVTRRAAREAVVRWAVNNSTIENQIKENALFASTHLPAGAEISKSNITIDYLDLDRQPIVGGLPANPGENITRCVSEPPTGCIGYVRVRITGATYVPMAGFFSGIEYKGFPFSAGNSFKVDLRIPIPLSTVTMPAESMGYPG